MAEKPQTTTLSNIFKRIEELSKIYDLKVGQVMSILGKSLEVDVFYLTDEELIIELDKLILKQKNQKNKQKGK